MEAVLNDIINGISNYDSDKVVEACRKALRMGVDPVTIIEDGVSKGLEIVGKKFENGELFLIHLVAASEAAKRALTGVLEPKISKSKKRRKTLGKVVIGTASGDIHDIGKNIVAAMMFSSGFEVYDMGRDVPTEEFVKKIKDLEADIVGVSALLSTTMAAQREIVEALVNEGIRNKVKVMVGGAPVTKEWARKIGADAYASDAVEAVRIAKELLCIKE